VPIVNARSRRLSVVGGGSGVADRGQPTPPADSIHTAATPLDTTSESARATNQEAIL